MSTPQEIRFAVEQLKRNIMEGRESYKKIVFDLYRESPLLYKGKDCRNNEIVKNELTGYYEMIGHCLIIGDSDVLYEFGIKPLKDIHVLARPQQLNAYIHAFETRFDNEETPEGMKFYLAMLIRAFKSVKGEHPRNPILNVD